MKTMGELYGEEGDEEMDNHLACDECGFCVECGDCKCGENKNVKNI